MSSMKEWKLKAEITDGGRIYTFSSETGTLHISRRTSSGRSTENFCWEKMQDIVNKIREIQGE